MDMNDKKDLIKRLEKTSNKRMDDCLRRGVAGMERPNITLSVGMSYDLVRVLTDKIDHTMKKEIKDQTMQLIAVGMMSDNSDLDKKHFSKITDMVKELCDIGTAIEELNKKAETALNEWYEYIESTYPEVEADDTDDRMDADGNIYEVKE